MWSQLIESRWLVPPMNKPQRIGTENIATKEKNLRADENEMRPCKASNCRENGPGPGTVEENYETAVDEIQEHAIQNTVNHLKVRSGTLYRVRWFGYSGDDKTLKSEESMP